MSMAQNDCCLSPKREERRSTPDVRMFGCDEKFLDSLREFIEHERQCQQCPAEGPDELRYMIYRSAFSKVIERATSYKRLLSTIKSEYDDVIRALTQAKGGVRAYQRPAAGAVSVLRHKSLISCQRRAANLKDRISALQKETAELREEIKRNKLLKEQTTWIPGLSLAESEDAVALDAHLKHLQTRRAALLDLRSRRVPPEVQAELEARLQSAERHRELKRAENKLLKLLFQRLSCVCERLSKWEEEGEGLLEGLLVSTLEDVGHISVTEEEEERRIDAELFQEQEPTGADESKRMTEHLERFVEVWERGEYEEAAVLAARSPGGVLRNLDVMEMFEGVRGVPGSRPPALLFFRALMVTAPAGERLPRRLSLQLAACALRGGALQLLAHAVTQRKLAFSEELGDALSRHALRADAATAATVATATTAATAAAASCLSLATEVYQACGLHRKTALCLSRRGLSHSAAQLISRHPELTTEDVMWVLRGCPSLPLLQLLTEPEHERRAAILSVGVACEALLAHSGQQHQRLALQLLDGFVSRGVLKEAILRDDGARPDVWGGVAALCGALGRGDLSREVRRVVEGRSGSRMTSPDPDGAQLMDHVFL